MSTEDADTRVTESVVVAATPDAAWKVVGDVSSVARWVPGLSGACLDGDLRRLTYQDGSEAVERIVDRDDAARSYVYDYLSGRRSFDRYRSRLSVRAHGGGSEVVWTSSFTAGSADVDAQLAVAISERYRSALQVLAREVEE